MRGSEGENPYCEQLHYNLQGTHCIPLGAGDQEKCRQHPRREQLGEVLWPSLAAIFAKKPW